MNNKKTVCLDSVKLFDIDFKFFVVLDDENFKSYVDFDKKAIYLKFKLEKHDICFSSLQNDFNNIILPVLFKLKNINSLNNYELMFDCFVKCCDAWGYICFSLDKFYKLIIQDIAFGG